MKYKTVRHSIDSIFFKKNFRKNKNFYVIDCDKLIDDIAKSHSFSENFIDFNNNFHVGEYFNVVCTDRKKAANDIVEVLFTWFNELNFVVLQGRSLKNKRYIVVDRTFGSIDEMLVKAFSSAKLLDDYIGDVHNFRSARIVDSKKSAKYDFSRYTIWGEYSYIYIKKLTGVICNIMNKDDGKFRRKNSI